MYTLPLGDIIRSHGLSCHFYADDIQIYCSFKPEDQKASISAIEPCVKDIDTWMIANKLKLNKDKSKLLVIGGQHRIHLPIEGIRVVEEYINASSHAWNIGVTFDKKY